MGKINFSNLKRGIHSFCILSLILSPFSLIANEECHCCLCGNPLENEEEISYDGLEEYEDIFKEFEERIEQEESAEVQMKGFFLKKWCKNLKKWFKKTVAKVLKKMVNFKKIRNADECAYTVAKFKRDVDEKLHNTGDIENMLQQFGSYTDDPQYSGLNAFQDKIRYYYHNKKARPPKHPDHNRYDFCLDCKIMSKDQKKNDLEDVPIRALIGGVEIACGCLIEVLPFPGCQWLGWTLICHGSSQIYEGYMNKYENEQYQKSKDMNNELQVQGA